MTIDFDLTHFIKETQLQHGLRSEDYERYHAYLSNRLSTLRKQLNLSNDRKRFLHKEVTSANATDARHLMLLALYAERCWAEAESAQEKRQALKAAPIGEVNKPKGGLPPKEHGGKRLNKAVKWTEKLRTVANAVGSPRLQQECEAYHWETMGRCAASHARFSDAKAHFIAARELYYGLHRSSQDAQRVTVQLKINELDDRVVFCMQRLNEDPATYTPPVPSRGRSDDEGERAGSCLKWNESTLNVSSIKVKDALREARSVPVEAAQAKALELPGVVPVGQTNKVLDLMDRRINSYNDALAHARQDLRGGVEGSSAKVELQLIVHYFLFQVSQETLRRTLFLAEVYSRRFHATEKVVRARGQQRQQLQLRKRQGPAGKSGRKSEIAPAQFASPLEVVRLYDAAADAVEQMELLPGAADRSDVEEADAVAKAGKLIYTGEGWRIVGDSVRAEKCFRAAIFVLSNTAKTMPETAKLLERAEVASLQMAAESVLSPSTTAGSGGASAATLAYLTDAAPEQVAAAQNVVQFPPDYQATVCKPAFVDIASTYVVFQAEEADPVASSTRQPLPQAAPSSKDSSGVKTKESSTAAEERKAEGSGGGRRWSWKWGWGS